MITDTKDKIIAYVSTNKQARADDLIRAFHLSPVAIHKQLKNLVQKGILKRIGKPPLVFYALATQIEQPSVKIEEGIKKVIDENYLYISAIGELLEGFNGFVRWAREIKEEARISQLAAEYVQMLKDLDKYHTPETWIDASDKLKNTFPESFVDKLIYGDFYSIPKFGKTKLGQLVLYAKQAQNQELIGSIATQIKPLVEKVIEHYQIEAVAFIPPTIPRQLQFMNELANNLNLNLPIIDLVKTTPGDIVVAQKTLTKLEERITNARETIYMKHIAKTSFSNILLIDDAAGSGATFNETAKKLKSVMVGKNMIIAFAVVGNIKGFDVIREV